MKFKLGERVIVNKNNRKLYGEIGGPIELLGQDEFCYIVILDEIYINGEFSHKALVVHPNYIESKDTKNTKIYGGFYSQEDLICGKSTTEVLERNGFRLFPAKIRQYWKDGELYFHAQRPNQIGPIWLEKISCKRMV